MNSLTPLSEGRNINILFPARKTKLFKKEPPVRAVKNASLKVFRGQSIAIVGESGSGKTTLIKALLGLQSITSGEAYFDGNRVSGRGRELWLRRRTGMIFQDPYSSLNPRMTIEQSITEPLRALKISGNHKEMAANMLKRLDLDEGSLERYPNQFSGGQRQRIAIARALVHSPEMLVGDEPVSALDVMVRERIIEMLKGLRKEMGLTMVTVTHDLAVVPDLAERVIVLRRGEIVESGKVAKIFGAPQHEYTKSLISALPRLPAVNTGGSD